MAQDLSRGPAQTSRVPSRTQGTNLQCQGFIVTVTETPEYLSQLTKAILRYDFFEFCDDTGLSLHDAHRWDTT